MRCFDSMTLSIILTKRYEILWSNLAAKRSYLSCFTSTVLLATTYDQRICVVFFFIFVFFPSSSGLLIKEYTVTSFAHWKFFLFDPFCFTRTITRFFCLILDNVDLVSYEKWRRGMTWKLLILTGKIPCYYPVIGFFFSSPDLRWLIWSIWDMAEKTSTS